MNFNTFVQTVAEYFCPGLQASSPTVTWTMALHLEILSPRRLEEDWNVPEHHLDDWWLTIPILTDKYKVINTLYHHWWIQSDLYKFFLSAKISFSRLIGMSHTQTLCPGVKLTRSVWIDGRNFKIGSHKFGVGFELRSLMWFWVMYQLCPWELREMNPIVSWP